MSRTNDKIRLWAWIVVLLLCVVMCSRAAAQNGMVIVNGASLQWTWKDAEHFDVTYSVGPGGNSYTWVRWECQSGGGATVTKNGMWAPVAGSEHVTVPAGSVWKMVARRDEMGTNNIIESQEKPNIVYSGVPNKKAAISVRNTSDVPVTYHLRDANGNVFGNAFTLQPGEGISTTFEVPGDMGELTLEYQASGYRLDSNDNWIQASDGNAWYVATKTGSDGTKGPATITVQDVSGQIVDSIDPPAVVPGGTGLESRSGGSVWKNVADATTAPVDLVTKGVFREGIDKVTKRMDDAAKAERERDEDKEMGSAALKGTLTELKGKGQAALDSGKAAAEQGSTEAKAVLEKFGPTPTTPDDPGMTGADTVELNIGTKTLTMSMNPFSSGFMASAAAFIRRLIAWGIVATFFVWCLGRIREMIRTPFQTAAFGDSLAQSVNSIKVAGFGGGVGYAVKVAVYALVLAFMLTMPLTVMAGVTAGLPWQQLVSVWTAGPFGGMAAGGMLGDALAMANQVVPWAMLMSAPIWYFLVEFVLFPSEFFWMMFIKFLPI